MTERLNKNSQSPSIPVLTLISNKALFQLFVFCPFPSNAGRQQPCLSGSLLNPSLGYSICHRRSAQWTFEDGRKKGREARRNKSLCGPLSHDSDLTLAKTLPKDAGPVTSFVRPNKSEGVSFKSYYNLQDGNLRPLNQVQGSGPLPSLHAFEAGPEVVL